VAADPGRRPRMRAGSGSPPEPMLAAEKNSWRRIQGGALGGGRAAGRPQGQCAPGLRFAPPLGSGSPLGRRHVLSFTGIGGEGAAPRSDGSTCRPPALLRAEGCSCRWPPRQARGQGPTPERPLVTGPRQQCDKGKEQGAPRITSQFGISAMDPR